MDFGIDFAQQRLHRGIGPSHGSTRVDAKGDPPKAADGNDGGALWWDHDDPGALDAQRYGGLTGQVGVNGNSGQDAAIGATIAVTGDHLTSNGQGRIPDPPPDAAPPNTIKDKATITIGGGAGQPVGRGGPGGAGGEGQDGGNGGDEQPPGDGGKSH